MFCSAAETILSVSMESTQLRNVFYFTIVSFVFTSSSPASEGQIRLAGSGTNHCSGRVEIFYSNTWGTVCDDNWDLNDATVVCRELGCGVALGAPQSALFGEGSGQIWLQNVACSGNEKFLAHCQYRRYEQQLCDHTEDAGVICTGVPVRLTGSTQLSGRVEIYYNNIWGRVCDNGWDINDASVVCRELGYGAALSASHLAHSGEGSELIWLDDVACSGSESSLSMCQHGGFGKHNCTHSKDAGVVCSGVPIRFVGPTLCTGRVEIYNNTWGTICGNSWDLNDGSVVCRELGCESPKKVYQSVQRTIGQISLNDVNCSGSERSLTECQYRTSGEHNCSQAVVICQAIFPKPSIYIHPDSAVTRGQNISITCSISTQTQQLLHGTFTLNQISGSFSQNQTTTTNSATFRIIKVNFDNGGLYNCRYSQGLKTQDFNISDSVSLSVSTEKVSLWLLVS